MQMRPGHPARLTHLPDHLAPLDRLPCLHANRAQMAVHGDQPFTVVDEDAVAIEEVIAGVDDFSISSRFDRRAGRRRDVHACVRVARLVVENAPQAIGARPHPGDWLQQPQRGRRLVGEGRDNPLDMRHFDIHAVEIRFRQVNLAGRHLQ